MNLAELKKNCLIAAMALTQMLSGCGWIIAESARRDVSQSLNINAFRNQIIDILGKPSDTVFYDNPREADMEIPEASDELKHKLTVGYDDFMINGLVNTYKHEMSKSQAIDIYVGMSCVTLGLFEIIATPVSIMDVIKKYNEKYLLRIWYDQEYRYLAHTRTKIEYDMYKKNKDDNIILNFKGLGKTCKIPPLIFKGRQDIDFGVTVPH